MKLEEITNTINDLRELLACKRVANLEDDEYVTGAKDALRMIESKLGTRKLVSVKRLDAVIDEMKENLKDHEEKNDGHWVYYYCSGARDSMMIFRRRVCGC